MSIFHPESHTENSLQGILQKHKRMQLADLLAVV